MKRALALAAASLALAPLLDFRASAGAFDGLVDHDAPACLPLSDLAKVATVRDLNDRQFQAVRMAYAMLPPVSRELPPGDRAVEATAGDDRLLVLVDGEMMCSRFLEPDFVHKMIEDIGRGVVKHAGAPA